MCFFIEIKFATVSELMNQKVLLQNNAISKY
jgi:hypothetical protein